MPDFRSDTVTRPSHAMKEAMFHAALFAPSGTQTNLIALGVSFGYQLRRY